MIARLVLGTAQLGAVYGIANRSGMPSSGEVERILDLAWDSGIRMLDTAPAYGVALERIGKYHRERGREFAVLTKVTVGDSDRSSVERHIEEQARVLGVECLDTVYFHRYADTARADIFELLGALKHRGVVRRAGVSVYTNDEAAGSISLQCDAIQLPFNILDNRARRGAVLEQLKHARREVHARSVFLQGALLLPTQSLPSFLRPLSPVIERLLADLPKGWTLDEAALRYVLDDPLIDLVLIGAETPEQLARSVRIAEGRRMPADLRDRIELIAIDDSRLIDPSTWEELRRMETSE